MPDTYTKPLTGEQADSRYILSIRVDSVSYRDAVQRIMHWAIQRESRYVCVANVHSAMEAYDCREFQQAVNDADLVTPDGVPLVWALHSLNLPEARRIYGPDLTLRLLTEAEQAGVTVGFYGASREVLRALSVFLAKEFPKLKVAYSVSPPFRTLTQDENERVIQEINQSGACILFVGLGCPKQERWMAENSAKIRSALVGVGAAFDFLAGTKRQAPRWMMRTGFEWLFRLGTEPQRLWRRYLKNNPRFMLLFAVQWLRYFFSTRNNGTPPADGTPDGTPKHTRGALLKARARS